VRDSIFETSLKIKKMEKRKILLAAGFLLFGMMLIAQNGAESAKRSGKIIYEQTLKLDIQIEGLGEQFANALPKERKSGKVLTFNPEASLYKNYSGSEDNMTHSSGEATMEIKMMEPDDQVFCDLSSGKQVEKREFMSRIFLIEKEIESKSWKLVGEQREILGYRCLLATKEEDSTMVKAWYTPEIAVASGPASYVNLPGLVLAVEIDEGDRTIVATEIEFGEVDEKELKKPTKGKKMSGEDFKALVEEKMKEMGAEGGSGGGATFVIKIEQ
jgi:GLPGLI family protein